MERPTLETERLILRPFRMEDAPEVQRLAGAREVADTTLLIPHPYEDGMAEEWIGGHQARFEETGDLTLAVTLKEDGRLVGAVGLVVEEMWARAEIGYWIGVPYWKNGYATEAAREVVRYAFEDLGLNRIYASHFLRNPASARVMEKIGMRREGRLRQHASRWGVFEDHDLWAILASEFRGEGPQVCADVQLRWTDYMMALYAHSFRGRTLNAVLVFLVPALLVGFGFVGWAAGGVWKGVGLIAWLLASWLLLGYGVLLPWKARRVYRQQKDMQEPFRMVVDAAGIEFGSPSGASHLTWDYIHKWYETRRLFLVYRSDLLFHVVPVRCLEGAAREAFRGLLEEFLPGGEPRRD